MTDTATKTKTTFKDGDLVFVNGNRFSPAIVVGEDANGDVLVSALPTPTPYLPDAVKKEEGTEDENFGTVVAP